MMDSATGLLKMQTNIYIFDLQLDVIQGQSIVSDGN